MRDGERHHRHRHCAVDPCLGGRHDTASGTPACGERGAGPLGHESVPPPTVVVHVGAKPVTTGFVYWSSAVATNDWLAPSVRLAVAGATAIRATGPGATVSDWLGEFRYCAEAVSSGLPGLVSW